MAWRKLYAPWTVHGRRSHLQKILNQLQTSGAPAIRVPKVRKPPPRGVTATQHEIAQALAKAKPHERLLILLCWQLAIRSGEARRLTIADWNREEHTVSITAKGGKRRVLPTTGDVDELLAAAAQCATHPSDPAIAALHGRSLSRPALDAAWWRLKQKAGINPALRLHDLRRTTATNLYRITHDLRAVQEYLGHDALASTTHYLAPLGEQRLRELHQLLKFQSEVKQ